MPKVSNQVGEELLDDEGFGISFYEIVSTLREHLRLLLLAPLAAGAVGLGIAYLIPPTFTASTSFMPPQQAQGAAAAALASLGSLAGFAGGSAGMRNTGEQYVALMHSVTVSDRLVDQFKLMEVYDAKFRVDARKQLSTNVRITLGRKDGMINVAVDDTNPQRAADLANRYVDELRRLTGGLAVTEAQQRRAFFERQLQQSRDRLVQAQQALQASGFNAGALRAEPKAAAESYAKLKAEATAAEVRLQVMRGSLMESTPEVRQQQATLNALREQLARAGQPAEGPEGPEGPDYIGRYRDFKYQETLFELYARQFELARVDESREGALIQVIDPAIPPERKSRPRRLFIAMGTAFASVVLLLLFLVGRRVMAGAPKGPTTVANAQRPEVGSP